MNDLHRALGDIRSIRRQVALTTEFRGYGPLTLCATAGFALAAGLAQRAFVPDPVAHPLGYVAVWGSTAVLSLGVIGVQALTRSRRIHSGMANEMIRQAVYQFAPAAVTNVLLTAVLLRAAHTAPAVVWMLSGLWQIVYALGIFASCRFLPRAVTAAGAWFLGTGLLALSLTDARALSPWHMALPFALGQALIALVLYCFSGDAADEL